VPEYCHSTSGWFATFVWTSLPFSFL